MRTPSQGPQLRVQRRAAGISGGSADQQAGAGELRSGGAGECEPPHGAPFIAPRSRASPPLAAGGRAVTGVATASPTLTH